MILISGIVLWALIHLSTALAPQQRQNLIDKLGLLPYKGLFALAILGSLALIIIGFKAMPASSLYVPPAGLRHLTMLLMPLAVFLFLGARLPSNIKQYIRHPQLTGVKLWAVAHLLSNGELRSVVLFAGLLAWAVMEVVFINKRDGAWEKPAPAGAVKTVIHLVVALVATAGIVWAHPYLSGIALIPQH